MKIDIRRTTLYDIPKEYNGYPMKAFPIEEGYLTEHDFQDKYEDIFFLLGINTCINTRYQDFMVKINYGIVCADKSFDGYKGPMNFIDAYGRILYFPHLIGTSKGNPYTEDSFNQRYSGIFKWDDPRYIVRDCLDGLIKYYKRPAEDFFIVKIEEDQTGIYEIMTSLASRQIENY